VTPTPASTRFGFHLVVLAVSLFPPFFSVLFPPGTSPGFGTFLKTRFLAHRLEKAVAFFVQIFLSVVAVFYPKVLVKPGRAREV